MGLSRKSRDCLETLFRILFLILLLLRILFLLQQSERVARTHLRVPRKSHPGVPRESHGNPMRHIPLRRFRSPQQRSLRRSRIATLRSTSNGRPSAAINAASDGAAQDHWLVAIVFNKR